MRAAPVSLFVTKDVLTCRHKVLFSPLAEISRQLMAWVVMISDESVSWPFSWTKVQVYKRGGFPTIAVRFQTHPKTNRLSKQTSLTPTSISFRMQFSTIISALALAAVSVNAAPALDTRDPADDLIDIYSPSTGCTPFGSPFVTNATFDIGCTNVGGGPQSYIVKHLGPRCTSTYAPWYLFIGIRIKMGQCCWHVSVTFWGTPNCQPLNGVDNHITVVAADPTPSGCKSNGGALGTQSINVLC